MRSNTWKKGMLLALASMALPVLALAATHDALVGTWKVQVTQVDCSSGNPLGHTFTSMITFELGGTMIEDTTNPAFGRGQRGDGQGTWSSTGASTYSAKTTAFIKYTTPPNSKTHNPGFEEGQQTISQKITYASGQWNSTAAVTFADGSGSVYRQGCAVATGTPF